MKGIRRVGQFSSQKPSEEDVAELDFDQGIENIVDAEEKSEKIKHISDCMPYQQLISYNVLNQPYKGVDFINPVTVCEATHAESLNSLVPKPLLDKEVFHAEKTHHVVGINNLLDTIVPFEISIDHAALTMPDPASLADLNSEEEPSLNEDVDDDQEKRSVYVKNVHISTTPEDLELHFKSCGEISRITILVDKYTGLPKGYAYIEFANTRGKEKAKLFNDSTLLSLQIKVDDKRKNLPDYYGEQTKKFKRPVFATENYVRGSHAFFGPLKGKYLPDINFQPY